MNIKTKEPISFNVISKYRSILMGLSIISVIFFHYTNDCLGNHYNARLLFKYYQRYIGSCGVDVFLFLSGLGLYYSFKKNPDVKSFFQKRFARIIIPYLLIAIPSWFYKDVCVRGLSIAYFLKDLLFVTFFTEGNRWFWYILLILVCYVIFPYMFKYIDSPGSISKMINLFTFITVLGIMLELYCFDFYSNIGIALMRFPAFFLGCFVGKASYHNYKFPKEAIAIPILTLLMLQLRNDSIRFMIRYIAGITGIVLFVCIAVAIHLISDTKLYALLTPVKKIIEWCGAYSLELYLTHVSIRYVFNHLGFPTYRIRYECLMLLASILVSIIVKKLSDYIMKHTFYKK